ncbi:MAG: hypothetical protein Sapg2KO_43650 [Saprospiraceae bacterium]
MGEAKDKKTLIISFGGLDSVLAGTPPFEFLKTLNTIIPTCDKYFIIDKHQLWYHKGINEMAVDIPTTKDFLAKLIAPYEKVLFIGNSAGAYAAILFGSLLNIDLVLAFVPQTYLYNIKKQGFDERYLDLNSYINKSTNYVIYGRNSTTIMEDSLHHISHCENIEKHDNVAVHSLAFLDLKVWRDNGILKKIILDLLKKTKEGSN